MAHKSERAKIMSFGLRRLLLRKRVLKDLQMKNKNTKAMTVSEKLPGIWRFLYMFCPELYILCIFRTKTYKKFPTRE